MSFHIFQCFLGVGFVYDPVNRLEYTAHIEAEFIIVFYDKQRVFIRVTRHGAFGSDGPFHNWSGNGYRRICDYNPIEYERKFRALVHDGANLYVAFQQSGKPLGLQ